MDLQHQQLKQLTDWLDVTEDRIKRMGAQPLGPDLEDVKHQVEEHKVGSPTPGREPSCLRPPLGSMQRLSPPFWTSTSFLGLDIFRTFWFICFDTHTQCRPINICN